MTTKRPGKIRIIGFILLLSLISITAPAAVSANIDSPQGALDVACMVPGKYAFLAKAVKAQEPAPTQKPEQNTPAPAPKQAKANDAKTNDQAAMNIDTLIGLMRQATETSSMIPQKTNSQAQAKTTKRDSVKDMLDVVAQVPQKKPRSDARALIKARGFAWPVDGNIYSAFAATRGKRGHGAVDIVAPRGTAVGAASDGVVSVVANGGRNFSGYGKIVIIDHGSGVHTVYAHLDSFNVKMGQNVRRGQVVGTVGHTGRVTTNLLHYEVRVDGKKIDPLLCMEDRPGVVKMVNYKSPKKK